MTSSTENFYTMQSKRDALSTEATDALNNRGTFAGLGFERRVREYNRLMLDADALTRRLSAAYDDGMFTA